MGPVTFTTLAELGTAAATAERSGDWNQATEQYALLFARGVEERDLAEAANALRGAARVRLQQRLYDEAEELAQLSLEISERNGLDQEAARAVNVLAMLRHSHGDLDVAERLYNEAFERALQVGDDQTIGYACQNLGVVANMLGNLREARVRYLESIGSSVRSGNKANAMMAYNNLGMASADLGEWMEAEIYFDRGIEIARRISAAPLLAKLYANRAEPLIHVGDLSRARESLELANEVALQTGDQGTLSDVARFRGMIARLEGSFSEAEEHFARAIAFATAGGLKLEHAEALRELCLLRNEEGRTEDAVSILVKAREIFREIGAERDVARMDELLRRWTETEAAAPSA
jgi:tetratricopeptide (TPR) repeat protein